MKFARFAVLLGLSMCGGALVANPTGAPPRMTGAPGDDNCTACHGGTANSGQGNIQIVVPGGPTYTPGVPMQIQVRLTDPGLLRGGFALTARPDSAPSTGIAGILANASDPTRVVCHTANGEIQSPCPASPSMQYITHTRPVTPPSGSRTVTFNVTWTPPAASTGDLKLYAAGNAVVGGNYRIYTSNTSLQAATSSGPRPAITSGGVVSAATASVGIADGGFFSVYGSNLASATANWDSGFANNTAPTMVSNVRVLVNDRPAFVSFVSPAQINAIAPAGTPAGPVNVVVEANGQRSDALQVTAGSTAPAFFEGASDGGRRYLAATTGTGADFRFILPTVNAAAPGRPARPGETIVLYGSGFGPTNPATAPGVLGQANPLATQPTIRFGDTQAVVAYAGGSGLVGLYQLNVVVPTGLADGDYLVRGNLGGTQTQNNVFIRVQR